MAYYIKLVLAKDSELADEAKAAGVDVDTTYVPAYVSMADDELLIENIARKDVMRTKTVNCVCMMMGSAHSVKLRVLQRKGDDTLWITNQMFEKHFC